MAKYALQSSNVFAYTFGASGNPAINSGILVGNNNPVLNIAGESFTIECWIKPAVANATQYQSLFAKRQAATTASAYQGYIYNSNNFIAAYFGNPAGDQAAISARPTLNTWSHVAWVFNQGANLRMFLNGSNVAVNTSITSTVNVDSVLSIGFNFGQTFPQYFGDISNLRIIKGQAIYSGNFNIPTFPFQLPNNAIGYHAGTPNVAASLTGNVVLLTCNDYRIQSNGNTVLNNFTAVGDVYPHGVDTKDLQNFSYYYPGNTNFQCQNATVLVTNATNVLNLNTADFTIETWFYPTSPTGVILERGYAAERNNLASYILTWDTVNNSVNFASANANNAAGYAVGGLTGPSGNVGAPTLNAWNHIAISRTGTTYRGFLNGTLNLNITTNANNPYDAVGRGVTIGGMFSNTFASSIPSNTISGYISNLRIIRGNSIYNASFTANTTQLTNVTNTILLTGLTPAFEDLSGNHTLAVNGMNQIFFSPASPFTANAVVNGVSNLSSTSKATSARQSRIYSKFNYILDTISSAIPNATSARQGRIYSKFNYIVNSVSPFLLKTTSARQGRIYDKYDIGRYSFPTIVTNYTGGRRQGRIYSKFNYIVDVSSSMIPKATSGRQGRIYSKVSVGQFGYMVYPGSNVTISNVTYQFWS